jgi:hypothetical protein
MSTSADLSTADSRGLHEPFATRLSTIGGRATFLWLVDVLQTQTPALRSSNAFLVAYTGCGDAIDWLEGNVDSPVMDSWGRGAALLGTPWPRLVGWLQFGGSRRLMALDSLFACRSPAPNMAPLDQIVAPTLGDPPTPEVFAATLAEVLQNGDSPRVRNGVQAILDRATEILARRKRRVAVTDLPRLFLQPEAFPGAEPILEVHHEVTSGIRKSIQELIDRDRNN